MARFRVHYAGKRVIRSDSPASVRQKRGRLLIAAGLLIIVMVALFICGRLLDNSTTHETYGILDDGTRDIIHQGVRYTPRMRLTTLLFIGVDMDTRPNELVQRYRNGGQSDFLMLLVLDADDQMIHRIQIDRDTMAQITVLGVLGDELGTSEHQICLAHSFGDGREQSCRYVVQAVSRLLGGINIDGYYALSLSGVKTLNALLGGVTVTLEDDDLAPFDPAMVAGRTLTLTDEQAELLIRSRLRAGEGTNAERMNRQSVFLNSAMAQLTMDLKAQPQLLTKLTGGLEPYVVTDIAKGRLINEGNRAAQYDVAPIRTLEGVHTVSTQGYMEFHANESAIRELVMEVFYTPSNP